MSSKRILRTREAAEYCGLAPATLEKLRATGGGPAFIRLGTRAIGYDIRDLDRWLDGQRQPLSPDDPTATRTPDDDRSRRRRGE